MYIILRGGLSVTVRIFVEVFLTAKIHLFKKMLGQTVSLFQAYLIIQRSFAPRNSPQCGVLQTP